jgi:hypothetical protein
MRLLVEASGRMEEWQCSFEASANHPRLPLPFSTSAAFCARGHEISAISFSGDAVSESDAGYFRKCYGKGELKKALFESDLALFWAATGIRAVVSDITQFSVPRKVMLASYVWAVPRDAGWRGRRLATATRLAARFAGAVVLITDEQSQEANLSLAGRVPALRFTWGIDSTFYRQPSAESDISLEVRKTLNDLLSGPYFILAGDQLRLDDDALELVEKHNLRLVRVPQEKRTGAWYRQQVRERGLEGRLFIFERVDSPTLRYLLQHATAYVGLVDSTWQPAGWTVLCESLASGTPAVVYEGITTREMRRLGAGEYLSAAPHRDVAAMASACRRLANADGNPLRTDAANFSAMALDLERTASSFVDSVERISGA